MAGLERRTASAAVLDDTHQLRCRIENAQNLNGHTEYTIKVQRFPAKQSWSTSRRFKEFVALNSELNVANFNLPLPRKKFIGNMQPSFVAERQIALQNYLTEVLKQKILSNTLAVKQFLDPRNYTTSFYEQALQNVSIALRGDGDYDLKQPLPGIGWRVRKHYFLVISNNSSEQEERLLVWQSYGPDRYLPDKSMQLAYKSLQSMNHPSIDKALFMHSLETGAYSIRKKYPNGTVKDMIYSSQWNTAYLAKYGNPKIRKPLTASQLAYYGLQILEALKFLHDRGLGYGHLHVGNIAIENQRALLLDVENGILGIPCFYRPYILELKRINSLEAIDVYCFGHTLYEMAFAAPLEQPTCDNIPQTIPTQLVSLLKSILSPVACKKDMPSLDDLLSHDFFNPAALMNGFPSSEEEKCQLKFPMQIKDQIKATISCTVSRIKSDQKLVRSERRQVKIQEILNSEEEMRKQIRKAKKRDSTLARSHSSLSGANSAISPLCTNGNGNSLGARSNSIASSISDISSLTAPLKNDTPQTSTSTSNTPSSPQDTGRPALLSAICSFQKSNLKSISGG